MFLPLFDVNERQIPRGTDLADRSRDKTAFLIPF
jgi:hypothetical protein